MDISQPLVPPNREKKVLTVKKSALITCIVSIGVAVLTSGVCALIWKNNDDGQRPSPRPVPNVTLFSNIPVQDTHMHLSNWSLINYTYPHDTINYHNWTYEDYVKATRPSALVTKSFMMMGLVGVPHSEQLTQSMWVQKVANEITTEPKMAGHVSTISATEDLPMGDKFVKYLDELQDKVPITVGCRCAFPDVPPPGMVDGLKELDRRNLTFDIFVVNVFDTEASHAQLAKAIEIAQQVPELTMVLDHMGVAGIAGAKLPDFTRWSRDIELLAKLPNTYIKISGPAIGIEEIRPFVHQSIRTFGYERSIYSTNWYVIDSEEYFFSYRAWASAMVLFLEELNATEEDAHWVLHKAAEKAYRLPPL